MRFVLILILAAGLAFADEEDYSPFLRSLDAIVDRAPDFFTFYENEELKEELFSKLHPYMDLSRGSYETILKQVHAFIAQHPEHASLLWNKRKVGKPITIEYQRTHFSPYGLNRKNLDRWLANYRSDVRDYVLFDQEQIRKLLISIETRNAAAQRKINNRYGKDPRGKEVRERYNQMLRNSKEVREVASFFLAAQMDNDDFQYDALHSNNSEAVLGALHFLSGASGEVFQVPGLEGAKIPKVVQYALRDMAPNPDLLVKDSSLFRPLPKGNVETETIYEVHRPLYAIFRGAPIGECVGGGPNNLAYTNLARTAVPLLHGTRVQYAESNGKWSGFLEMTPVANSRTKESYDSLIIGHSGFRNQIFRKTPKGEVKTSLYEAWLTEMTPRGNRFVMGQSRTADNAQSMEWVKSSLSYEAGKAAGTAEEFIHTEANKHLVGEIVAAAGKDRWNYGGRGQMIIDAMLSNAGKMTELYDIPLARAAQIFREMSEQDKLAFLERTSTYSNDQKQNLTKHVRAYLDDPSRLVQRQTALWLLPTGQEKTRLMEVLAAWTEDPNITGEDIVRLARSLSYQMKDLPVVRAALLSKVSRVEKIEEILYTLVNLRSSPTEGLRVLGRFTNPRLTPDAGQRLRLIQIMEGHGLENDNLLFALSRDPELAVRILATQSLAWKAKGGDLRVLRRLAELQMEDGITMRIELLKRFQVLEGATFLSDPTEFGALVALMQTPTPAGGRRYSKENLIDLIVESQTQGEAALSYLVSSLERRGPLRKITHHLLGLNLNFQTTLKHIAQILPLLGSDSTGEEIAENILKYLEPRRDELNDPEILSWVSKFTGESHPIKCAEIALTIIQGKRIEDPLVWSRFASEFARLAHYKEEIDATPIKKGTERRVKRGNESLSEGELHGLLGRYAQLFVSNDTVSAPARKAVRNTLVNHGSLERILPPQFTRHMKAPAASNWSNLCGLIFGQKTD